MGSVNELASFKRKPKFKGEDSPGCLRLLTTVQLTTAFGTTLSDCIVRILNPAKAVFNMYENGKQMNRYANKMRHKRILKNRYRRRWFRGYTAASREDYVAHAKEWDRLEYWKTYYLSGVKNFSRGCTNGNLRARFREEKARGDYEAMHAPQHGEYRKYFDYWWTIY